MARDKSDHRLSTDVGNRLRVSREALRLTQNEFSARADIASNTYNQFEQGKRLLTIVKAIALCDAYGLTLDWIFRGDPGNLPYKLGNAIKALQDIR